MSRFSQTLTAMVIPAAVTYCTQDGTPYRADASRVVHVLASHVAELSTRGLMVATAADMRLHGHGRDAQSVTTQNVTDHG